MDSIWSPPANGHNLGHNVTKTARSARQLILTMVRKPGHHWRAYVLRKSQYGAAGILWRPDSPIGTF